MNQLQRLFQFGVFEVDTAARELRKGGLRVRIQDQPFELLAMLLQRPGEIVSRDAVREALWTSDTFVDFDHSLGTAVAKLRAALGDSARNPRFVETVANHGYKFIAPVTVVPAAPAVALAPLDLFVATPDASTRFVRWWTLRVASGLAVGAALLAVVLGLDLFAARDWLRQRTNPTIEALAVLPFENLSGDQGDSYLVDGVTESLITSLAQLRGARVISRTSSMQYRGTKKSLPAIAQELHVDALVEGSVVRSGSRVRVSAKLVDARTDAHLWARSYERDVRDVLTLQADVAQAIAEVLRVGREPGPQSSARSHRVLPDAQDAYLRGRYHLNQGEELSIRKSVDDFRAAIAADPSDARSYAGVAEASIALTDYYEAPNDMMPRARAAAQRAVELDPSLSEAHAALGAVRFLYDWDWSGAERELKLAAESGGGSSDAHLWYGVFLAQMGRIDEATREIRLAETLDPLSVGVHLNAGWVMYLARRNDDAIGEWRKASEIEPNLGSIHTSIWLGYLQLRDVDQARVATTGAVGDSSPMNLATLAGIFAVTGKQREAADVLAQLEGISATRYVCPYELATAHAALGHSDRAIDCLRKAVAERSICAPDIKTDPRLDGLRGDPRFAALMKDVGFAP